jgi:hypothetical protein
LEFKNFILEEKLSNKFKNGHKNGDFVASFEDGIFDSTQEVAKRYNFKEADVPSILNYLNFYRTRA